MKTNTSWKIEVTTAGDPPGSWSSNALRFADKRIAEAYALDLAMRWTAVRDWRVVESDDPVNAALLIRVDNLDNG